MNFFNFKEQNKTKEVNKKIMVVMFFIVAIQLLASSYKSETKITEVELNDIQEITQLANNA